MTNVRDLKVSVVGVECEPYECHETLLVMTDESGNEIGHVEWHGETPEEITVKRKEK